MQGDPHDAIRRWLPHVVVFCVLGLGLWLLAVVFQPVAEPILLAAALALLTTHILFSPIDRFIGVVVPRLSLQTRQQISGISTTIILALFALAPVVLLLIGTLGSPITVVEVVWGIATGDTQQFDVLQKALAGEVSKVDQLYPDLDLADSKVPESIIGMIREATDFGPSFVNFIFKGTGALAQFVLALIALAFFYPQGGKLVRGLLHYSPLKEQEIEALNRRHRQVILRLLNDTVALAVAKGVCLGVLIWLIDYLWGTGLVPIVPVALLAVAMTLLPVVGVTMVWLPIAILFWSSDHHAAAIAVGIGSLIVHAAVEYLHHRIGKHIDDQRHDWMGFLLFLGLVGGLLSFGLKGFIIGPMAVVLVYTLGSFWLPLYGLGERAPLEDETDA